MPATAEQTPIESELTEALDELAAALKAASDAVAVIRSIAHRIAASGSVLDEIQALLQGGRAQGGNGATADAYPRPTLVAPGTPVQRPHSIAKRKSGTAPEPQAQRPPTDVRPVAALLIKQDEISRDQRTAVPTPPPTSAADEAGTSCFRLEFESVGGPLDLRAIDDAVSHHAVVRDVALLDYDGRRAMLKVWIATGSSPADVQTDLREQLPNLLAPGSDVRIVALEDVA